jgi:uncharacterized damage-inducible protein DinB
MISMMEPMLNELRQEAAVTRRVLERVPAGKLTWKPHAKSMTLGQLASHVATVPGAIAQISRAPQLEVNPADFTPPQPASAQEILNSFDESIKGAEARLAEISEPDALATWRVIAGGKEVMAMPRVAFFRAIMLNHWYHHRGQLSVYLRLLDIPLPSIYGPSADENPFA